MRTHKTNGSAIWVMGTFVLIAGLFLVYRSGAPASAMGFEPDNNTPQPVPFFQDWANRDLIISNDNWSGVPGIEGYYLRNDGVSTAGLDPRTILGDTFGAGTTTVELDVLANQPPTATTSTAGGIMELHPDAQGNPFYYPTIGMQPDDTVDAPFLLISLNTTGRENIEVQYSANDIDCTADDAFQRCATQFRIGNTGNFTNLPNEFIPDLTQGPELCNQIAIMGGDLPAVVNDQPLVQIRIIMTNAVGADEWVAFDFLEVRGTAIAGTPSPTPTTTPTPPPTLSINDVMQNEGNFGNSTFTFTVTRAGSLAGASSASYATVMGTATGSGPIPFPFDDYLSESGMVNFGPGQAAAQITITVFGDLDFEPDETFTVHLSNPVGATISDADGLGTITNDEPPPPPTPTVIMINEVDSDQTGNDAMEFIELYNGGAGNISLTGLIVVLYNGSDDLSYASFDLDGFSTNASGYFTIGNAAVPGVDLVIPDGLLQDGADAVAMYTSAGNFPNGTPVVTVNLRDAFVYDTGDPDDPGLLPLLLAGGQVDEDQGGNGTTLSMQRCPNGSGGSRDTTTYRVGLPSADSRNACSPGSTGTLYDFDGDRKADLSIFRPAVGEWYYQRSSNGVVNGFGFGMSTDKPVPADYTGDGKADIAFFRPSTSGWFVLRSEDSTFYAFPFGAGGDIPAPADFDGDAKTDAAVYRPSAQTWFILRSTGGVLSIPFGLPNDIPVPADYDGDGKADVGIYRPSQGQWWNLRSGDGNVFAATFGVSTDKPVAGDYTGDRKADVAFYRPSEGSWYVLRSEDFTYFAFPFGNPTDKPAPGDYDGDGKFDAAVFRPGDTNWYILRSTGGVQIQQFGAANDIPLPGAFIP